MVHKSSTAQSVFRIVSLNGTNIEEVLTVSDRVTNPLDGRGGVEPEKAEEYEENALVPDCAWRQLTATEVSQYIDEDRRSFRTGDIGYFQLSAYDYNWLQTFSKKFLGPHKMPRMLTSLMRTMRRYVSIEDGFEVLGVFSSEANLNTVTRSREARFIGMHVDNWDKKEIRQRCNARSRICVNLGPGLRYFLFCPVNLVEACERQKVCVEHYGRATQLARALLSTVPETKVLRIELSPGSAYVAPTENLIHDGSTSGQAVGSDALVCFGHFSSQALDKRPLLRVNCF